MLEQEPLEPLAVSIKQASKKTGLCRSLLCEAIRDGNLQARKAGRRTIILQADLEKWLQGLPAIGKAA